LTKQNHNFIGDAGPPPPPGSEEVSQFKYCVLSHYSATNHGSKQATPIQDETKAAEDDTSTDCLQNPGQLGQPRRTLHETLPGKRFVYFCSCAVWSISR